MIKKTVLYFLVLLVLACSSNKENTTSSTTGLTYQGKVKELTPHYTFYHQSEDTTSLYFQLLANELLYVRENMNQPFVATVQFHYTLRSEEDKKNIVDSASSRISIRKTSTLDKRITGKIPIAIPMGKNYFLNISAVDVNKKTQAKNTFYLNKTDKNTRQFYLLQKESDEICFTPFFTEKENIKITSHLNPNSTLRVNFYHKIDQISKPPFSNSEPSQLFNENGDSTFAPLRLKQEQTVFEIQQEGVYNFIANGKQVFLLNYMSGDFPHVISHQGMSQPLRYICTNKEFKALTETENKQEVVEDFWLRMGKSEERAKVLIREFYNRVYFANVYFTTYKPGWQTDRGMLSIVMGLPNTITESKNSETWVYGTANNMMMSLSFTFRKENTHIFANDYRLDRYRSYKEYWYRAVETWRQGRPFTFN